MRVDIFNRIKLPFIRETIIYGFGNISNSAVYLVLLPLLTKTFSPGEYGLMELISVTILIIATVAGLGLDTAILRFFHEEEEVLRKKIISSTIMVASLISALVIAALSLLFFSLVEVGIFSQAKSSLFLALADIPAVVFIANIQALLRIRKKALWFSTIAFSRILLTFVFTFMMIKFFSLGIASLFISIFIVDGSLSAISFFSLRNYCSLRFSIPVFKKTFSYSLPLIFSSLIIVLLANVNKYFLRQFHGFQAVGIYAVGQKICMALGIAGMSFRQAWIPHAFSIINQDDSRLVYKNTFRGFVLVFFSCAALLVLASPWLIPIISSEAYLGATVVVGYVCAGIILINISGSFFNLGIHIKQKTKFSFIAYAAGLAVNILLNILLIPKFSILGAGLALFAGYFVTAGILLYFSERLYRISYDLRLFFIILSVYLLFVSILLTRGSGI